MSFEVRSLVTGRDFGLKKRDIWKSAEGTGAECWNEVEICTGKGIRRLLEIWEDRRH